MPEFLRKKSICVIFYRAESNLLKAGETVSKVTGFPKTFFAVCRTFIAERMMRAVPVRWSFEEQDWSAEGTPCRWETAIRAPTR